MAQVRTNPESLRRVATAIENTDKEVSEAVAMIRSALDGVRWDDAVRRQFDAQFEELMRSAQSFHQQAATAAPFLKKKAGELSAYLGN